MSSTKQGYYESTISEIHEAFKNANFTNKPLDETLDEILDEFYWKAVNEYKESLNGFKKISYTNGS